MSPYLKYLTNNFLICLGILGMAAGGIWLWTSLALGILVGIVGDALLGDDTSQAELRHPWILDLNLYLSLPLLVILTLLYAFQLSTWDFLGLGWRVQALTGFPMLAAREASSALHLLGGGLGLGLFYGVGATNVGHELTHRTWSRPAMLVGRWLLAFTADASFSIYHVFGHHLNVGTRPDPATARRGESAWAFVLRSSLTGYQVAWRLEAARLARSNRSVWGPSNRMLRGAAMTLVLCGLFWGAAGPWGGLGYLVLAAYGKMYLELVNYVEHYGLVRAPDGPVEGRHSWNCNRRMSTWVLYNLPRHSHHHAMGEKPFYLLQPWPQAPMMPAGYLIMICLAAIPPLWHRVMTPRVLEWDRHFSTPAERPYIAEANRLSGLPAFQEAQAAA